MVKAVVCAFSLMLAITLVSCGGEPPEGNGSSSSSSSSTSSSSASSSSSSSAASSSSTSSSSSASSSGATLGRITIEESAPGFCAFTGDVDNQHPGFMGPGFVDSSNEMGASISWQIEVQKAGNYAVEIRYANGGGAARGARLSASQSGSSAELDFDVTAGWADWAVASGNLSLSPGENTLTLSALTSAGLANIDAITLLGDGIHPANCPEGVSQALYPPNGALDVNPDVQLRITFDSSPVIQGGVVQIFDASTMALVDSFNVQQDADTLGYLGQSSNYRDRATRPVQIRGRTVYLQPHAHKLNYGKTYYVVINNGVFSGQVGGQGFQGVSARQWQFSTKSTVPSGANVTVDDDGPADFSTVQGALNHIMKNVGLNENATISVKNGTYVELLYLADKNNLKIMGESAESTVIAYANGEYLNAGTRGRPLFLVYGGGNGVDQLMLENITLHSTELRSVAKQAEAIFFDPDNGRLLVKNAVFLSEQDTLNLDGYAWFYNSTIAGNVDFIWGSAKTALFENSEIRSLGDANGGGGYVLQARIKSTNDNGFVFLNSRFTRGVGPSGNQIADSRTFLARSGYSSSGTNYDSFAFINCQMDSHIADIGWYNENNKPQNPSMGTATYGFREAGTTRLNGAVVNLGARQGVYRLNPSEVNQWYGSRAVIFRNYDNGQGWAPSP